MKQALLIVFAVGLLVGGSAVLALAQSAPGMSAPATHYPSDDSWTGAMKPGMTPTGSQTDLRVTGKITDFDFAHRRMALDDGEQFTLPENPEYSSLPMIGQSVEVTFTEQNGQKVVQQIDLDDTGRSSHSS